LASEYGASNLTQLLDNSMTTYTYGIDLIAQTDGAQDVSLVDYH
jgi:hypothetical protein